MIPESKLIKNEIVLRELAPTQEVKLARKSMVRWLALSLGLISPNESRTLVLDLLEVLFTAHISRQQLTTQDILERLEKITGVKSKEKAVYYHLLRLKEFGILYRKNKLYCLGEEGESLSAIFKRFYSERMNKAFEGIEDVLKAFEYTV